MYRPNVSIIARKGDRYLIVHKPRKEDAWQFPQGGVDEGETEEEAVKREFAEEVGTDKIRIVGKSEVIYQYDFPGGYTRYSDSGKVYNGQRVSFWLVDFLAGKKEIILSKEELDDYRWVKKEELSEYFLRKEYLEVCFEVLKDLNTRC